LPGAVYRDGRSEYKTLALMLHRLVEQVDAADEVRIIIETTDKMGEAFSSVCRQVIYIIEFILLEQVGEKLVIGNGTFNENGTFGNMVFKTATQVVQNNNIMS
jgi:hypothetical protein